MNFFGTGGRRRARVSDVLAGGLTDGLTVAVAGLTTVGVLAVAVSAHDTGGLDRVLVATLALLALSSFEAVAQLPAAVRELSASLASGPRVLELTDRRAAVQDPPEPAPLDPRAGVTVALEGVTDALLTGRTDSSCGLRSPRRSGSTRCARRPKQSGEEHGGELLLPACGRARPDPGRADRAPRPAAPPRS